MVKSDIISCRELESGFREWVRDGTLEVTKESKENTALTSKISD